MTISARIRLRIARDFCVALAMTLAHISTPAVAAPNEIVVGVILPLSGPGAGFGEPARNALALASEEINASNQIRVRLIIEDSKTEPRSAVAAFHRLSSVEKVDAVIGELWDFLTLPLVPLSASTKTLTISPTVMDVAPGALSKSDYFWSLGSRVASLRPPTEKFLALNPNAKQVGIFCWSNPWGEAHLAMWRQAIQTGGRGLGGVECDNDFTSDLRPLVRRLVSRKPDAIFASTSIGTFAKRLSETRYPGVILSTSDIQEQLRDRSFDKKLLEGYYFTDWKEPEDFSRRYTKRFGATPFHEASKSYYALQALKEAALLRRDGEPLAQSIRRVVITKPDGALIDFSHHPFPNDTPATLFRVTQGVVVEQR
jgi:branched-chain amino acid transport system substrate-binding protein